MPEAQTKEKRGYVAHCWPFNTSRHCGLACAVAVPLQRVSLPFLQQEIQELITAPDTYREEEREFSNELTQVLVSAQEGREMD